MSAYGNRRSIRFSINDNKSQSLKAKHALAFTYNLTNEEQHYSLADLYLF